VYIRLTINIEKKMYGMNNVNVFTLFASLRPLPISFCSPPPLVPFSLPSSPSSSAFLIGLIVRFTSLSHFPVSYVKCSVRLPFIVHVQKSRQ
jgi:hypothetical protein